MRGVFERLRKPDIQFQELQQVHVERAINRLPETVFDLMVEEPSVVLAGGLLRSIVQSEPIRDVDLFVASKKEADRISSKFERSDEALNAWTLDHPKSKIQLIYRFKFDGPKRLLWQFDFSICQAAIWYDGERFVSCCSTVFYKDLASKTLRVCDGVPEDQLQFEKSILRAHKFFEMGYLPPNVTKEEVEDHYSSTEENYGSRPARGGSLWDDY